MGIQYYVDGLPYPSEEGWIERKKGIPEESQNYPIQLDLNAITSQTGETQGIRSLFVVGWDNSGNYVASNIHNISFTLGSDAPIVSLSNAFLDFELDDTVVDLNVSSDGEIIAITLEQAVGSELFAASAQINHPVGSGAEISAVIDNDPLSETFGRITGFEIENGGTDYNASNYSIQVIPIIRAINEGIPAEAGLTYEYEFNDTSQQNDFSSSRIALKQNLDGSLRTGSGYVIAPRLVTPPFSHIVLDGKSYERISLSPSTTNTSSVAPSTVSISSQIPDNVLCAMSISRALVNSSVVLNFSITSSLVKVPSFKPW